MIDAPRIRPRSVLLSFRFLGPALIGSLVMALVCAFGPLEAQLAVLGTLISILGGLFISYVEQEAERETHRNELLAQLTVPLALARDAELFDQFKAYCKVITDLADMTDTILRETAVLKLASVNAQLAPLSDGTVVFSDTEGWRTVYDKLLASPDVKEYRSVALVRTKDYWQDAPGRQSIQANYDAIVRGTRVERIIILRDELWPSTAVLPSNEILPWIREQHANGVWVLLVRENDLANEPDLRHDVGIYGDRAIGTQELDDRSRTVRFTLCFDPDRIRLALDSWQKLYLFGTSFRNLLDRAPDNA